MPRQEIEPVDYLNKRGRKIFQLIVAHLKEAGLDFDIDILQLTMLANSMELYESAAKRLNDLRAAGDAEAYGKGGKLSTDYQVMQKEYDKIVTHGAKFGLNPGDREKIFGGMKAKKKKSITDGLDDDEPMRIAK